MQKGVCHKQPLRRQPTNRRYASGPPPLGSGPPLSAAEGRGNISDISISIQAGRRRGGGGAAACPCACNSYICSDFLLSVYRAFFRAEAGAPRSRGPQREPASMAANIKLSGVRPSGLRSDRSFRSAPNTPKSDDDPKRVEGEGEDKVTLHRPYDPSLPSSLAALTRKAPLRLLSRPQPSRARMQTGQGPRRAIPATNLGCVRPTTQPLTDRSGALHLKEIVPLFAYYPSQALKRSSHFSWEIRECFTGRLFLLTFPAICHRAAVRSSSRVRYS